MEIAKRLEISSALAGLAGIVLTVSGLFLPWGSMTPRYQEILIPLNGLEVNYALTGAYALVALSIEIFGFFLLLAGVRKVASAILAAAASFMIFQTVMWLMPTNIVQYVTFYYVPFVFDSIDYIGPYTTVVGNSFIILAALLSVLQLRLGS
jgi:hypothetical protein